MIAKIQNKELNTIIVFAFLTTIILICDLIFYPDTLEDAFITFRYSKHLAEGYGYGAWNINGEQIEGYSNFLWMIMLAAANKIGFNIITTAKVIGVGAHFATCWLFLAFSKLGRDRGTLIDRQEDVFFLAAIFVACYLPFAWYASSGMESMMFVLLIVLVLFGGLIPGGPIITLLASGLLVLTRPEGILFALTINGFHLAHRYSAGKSVKSAIERIIVSVVSYCALLIFRIIVFGEFFPNTYYAKVVNSELSHVRLGVFDIASWLFFHIFVALVLIFIWVVLFRQLIIALRSDFIKEWTNRNLLPFFLFGFLVIYVMYILKIGGDDLNAFPYWRHMLHLSPFWMVLFCMGIVSFLPHVSRYLQIGLLLAILIVTDYHIQFSNSRMAVAFQQNEHLLHLYDLPHNEYYLWMDEYTEDNTVIASSLAGELPFVVDAVHIDILGLNDYHIAHYGEFDTNGPSDSKTDMNYVMDRKPDIIEGFISGQRINANLSPEQIITARKKMINDMLANPYFQANYVFLENGPYQYLDRALFLRRSWVENHPQKDEFIYISVTDTSVYQ